METDVDYDVSSFLRLILFTKKASCRHRSRARLRLLYPIRGECAFHTVQHRAWTQRTQYRDATRWLTCAHSAKTALDRWLTSKTNGAMEKRKGRLKIIQESVREK